MTISLTGLPMNTRMWLRTAGLLICAAVVGCSDPATSPRSSGTPQLSRNAQQEPHGQPDLTKVAQFRSDHVRVRPANDHLRIGPEGGALRVGDFEIVVPAGAVDREVNFRIKLPVDPKASHYAFAEFSPHITFNKPVTIRLPGTGIDELSGVAGWWSGTDWVGLPTTRLPDGRLETRVGHFSYYATCRKGIVLGGG